MRNPTNLLYYPYFNSLCFLLKITILFSLLSCENGNPSVSKDTKDTLTELELHLPENALKGLTIADGLTVEIN
jgi:hypothetical protein